MNDINDTQSYKLRDLLFKLGVQSAEVSTLEAAIAHSIRSIRESFGIPNRIIMPADTLEQYAKIMEGKK